MSGFQLFPSPSLPDSSGWNNQRLSRGDSEVTQMPWENRRWCALWVALCNMAARSPLPSPHHAVLNKKQVAAALCFACPDVFLIKWLVRPPRPLRLRGAVGSDKTGMLFVWCHYSARCAITGKSLLLENVPIYLCQGGSNTSSYCPAANDSIFMKPGGRMN